MNGKLIVIEGGDGCGKATQAALLVKRLTQEKLPVRKISFPNYGTPQCSLVEMYLNGEFGTDPNAVNAYSASTFYAVDRFASFKKEGWGQDYSNGVNIIADRYTTSNALFQAAKLPKEERQEFVEWLYDLEYKKMGLPKPDMVLYLDVPLETSEAMRKGREAETNTHADIHENMEMQRKVRESSMFVAKHGNWKIINCKDFNNGGIKPVEEIHKLIWNKVSKIIP